MIDDVPTRTEFDLIKLADKDRVVGCAKADRDTDHLVLISSEGSCCASPSRRCARRAVAPPAWPASSWPRATRWFSAAWWIRGLTAVW